MEYINFWIFEFLSFWIFEFLNFWIFEFLNSWIFEFLTFCIIEFLNFWIFQNFEFFNYSKFWKSLKNKKLFKNSQNQSKTRKSLKCTIIIQLHEYHPNIRKSTKLSNFDWFSSFLIIREIWNDFRESYWFWCIWMIFDFLNEFRFFKWRVHEWFSSFSLIFDYWIILENLNDFGVFGCFWSN